MHFRPVCLSHFLGLFWPLKALSHLHPMPNAALQQRDVACATYAEIGKRYKNVSSALKERVRAEQALAGC